jgi:hypothetical protein
VIEIVKFAIKAYNYNFEIGPRIDQSSHSSTLGTWFLNRRCKNPLIYHWLRKRKCSTDDLV